MLPHLPFVSYETHQQGSLGAGVTVASGRDPEREIRETVRKMSSSALTGCVPRWEEGGSHRRETVIHLSLLDLEANVTHRVYGSELTPKPLKYSDGQLP